MEQDPRFENLGPEAFQRFCQSLLSYELPDLVALEVGQPDGGRDAFRRLRVPGDAGEGFEVFQVKFVRNPRPLKEPEKWVASILKEERPKIERLIDRGATSYRLITNAMGSAHLDRGAVDRVSAYLEDQLPISTDCWWRNDLRVRLAKHPDLRWGYPGLLNATDVLRELVGQQLTEDGARRTSAIQAFLTTQFTDERFVRFRQVDLQTPLLDVFVDAPASVRPSRIPRVRRAEALVRNVASRQTTSRRVKDIESVGAADLLFSPEAGDLLPRVVLEGAPGQGKSTLAQYLCQVHRMRLLRRTVDLRRVHKDHQSGPARLPFKVDLRDFAAFLRGSDPFDGDPEWGGLPANYPRSLESFLASQVQRFSGGTNFTVADLQAVFGVSHVFIAFDGLDEVAEFKDRRLVVEAINAGSERLESLASGLQTVVTSRPAAFTHSPGFSAKEVPHLELVSLTRGLIEDYSERWTRARNLSRSEATDIRRVLLSQLDQPHIRDLARNPMQLAILLTLILTKGESLPDKRTDLYTSYLDIFFDREAAKDALVRQYRDRLFALHEYLGWKLHSAAEISSSGGSISEEELKAEVVSFLDRQGIDTSLANHLFKGMVERILALVSRVQGHFEFEVQPLREYFAASFLYSTARVSRLGTENPGTIEDRFDGLCRNGYWLNVVRFYAGFYNSGQLPSLVFRLNSLREDPEWALSNRPRMLAAMFLGDWSFALDKRSREAAIEIALEELGVRHAMSAGSEESGTRQSLSLPLGAGQEELVNCCWNLLDDPSLPEDRRSAIKRLLGGYGSTGKAWLDRVQASEGAARTSWLDVGWWIDGFESFDELHEDLLWNDGHHQDFGRRAAHAVSAGFVQSVESDEEKSRALARYIVMGGGCTFDSEAPSWLGILATLLEPFSFVEENHYEQAMGAASRLSRHSSSLSPTARDARSIVRRFLTQYQERFSQYRAIEDLLDGCRSHFGEGWGLYRCAFATIASRNRPSRPGPASDLFDLSMPILARVRLARFRGGKSAGSWWSEQARMASSPLEVMVCAAAAFSWPTKEALREVLPLFETKLKKLNKIQFQELCSQIRNLGWYRGAGRTPELSEEQLKTIPPRSLVALSHREPAFARRAFAKRLSMYRGSDAAVLRYCVEAGVEELLVGSPLKIGLIKRAYRGINGDLTYERPFDAAAGLLPYSMAEAIVSDPENFPLSLVRAAETRCGERAGLRLLPLNEIAAEDEWFAQEGPQGR